MTRMVRFAAAALAIGSFVVMLYVAYCAMNMNAPWLFREGVILLYVLTPVSLLAGSGVILAGRDTRLGRACAVVFCVSSAVVLIQLARFFALAYAVSHAF